MKIEDSRPSEFQRVSRWLDTAAQPGRVDIYGISGYGGIGKSYLLRHVLDQKRPVSKGFLKLQVDGRDEDILGDLMTIYEHQLAPRTITLGKLNFDYFPRARKLTRDHSSLRLEVTAAVKDSSTSDNVKDTARLIFRGGSILNKAIPKTKEYIDFDFLEKRGIGENIDEAMDLLDRIKPLANSRAVPGVIKNITGISYRERIKSDLYRLAADEWIADLSAILVGYRRKDRHRLTETKLKGLDKLLLIIDDFEILGKTIIGFVTKALISELEQANFHTTLIICGRDDLSDVHLDFQHHHAHLVQDKLRLEKFPDIVAKQMFISAGYGTPELPKLMEESQGYPFLVSLLCEAKGSSVSFYQQFFERTTRWMGPAEREWVLPLCYLDRITQESIPKVLPGANVSSVMEWFKHEASLRDPSADWYVIAPYIRRTLIEYHRKEIGTKKSDELVAQGRAASA